MNKIVLKIVIVLVLMLLSFVYGIFLNRYNIFPHGTISKIYQAYNFKKEKARSFSIDSEYLKTNVDDLISIKTRAGSEKKREELIRFIWGNSGLPLNKLPSEINDNFRDSRYSDLYEKSLLKIDYILIDLDFGLQSHIYHFIPKKDKNKLVVFHQGHKGDFIKNKELISELLNEGYSVAAFCMPLLGLNNQPTVRLPGFGYLKMTTHWNMKFIDPLEGHPVKYFLEPVVVFLNYISKEYDFMSIAMGGISGGGWTTTLVSAVDCRIRYSFPVAGSYPIYLRSNSQKEGDWGDWEQNVPELYRVCNYLDLYILGSSGKGRAQLQIINKYDPCCFGGIKWQHINLL